MEVTDDELAGVVDLFGALTRTELREALAELAFRRVGEARTDRDALAERIDDAVDAYRLVEFEDDGERLLAPGPAAFPTLPEGADDLPHIVDVEPRSPDREALGRIVEERFRAEAARAAAAGDDERIRRLLDVSYEVEAWAPVGLGDVRERLDAGG